MRKEDSKTETKGKAIYGACLKSPRVLTFAKATGQRLIEFGSCAKLPRLVPDVDS
jgi:hypothetical protein